MEPSLARGCLSLLQWRSLERRRSTAARARPATSASPQLAVHFACRRMRACRRSRVSGNAQCSEARDAWRQRGVRLARAGQHATPLVAEIAAWRSQQPRFLRDLLQIDP